MGKFSVELNYFLTDTFGKIIKCEEEIANCTSRITKVKVTVSELHFIVAVGDNPKGLTVSEIGKKLGITNPSVTGGVNKLVAKGFMEKHHEATDGRTVRVTLTPQGVALYHTQKDYYMLIAEEASKGLTKDERKLILEAMKKLNQFFNPDDVEKILNE